MSRFVTIKCKFCGKPVTGELVTDEKVEISKGVSQVVGTAASIISGNPIGAYRHATGKSEDSMLETTCNFLGGGYYSFHCDFCNQDFVKRVYK